MTSLIRSKPEWKLGSESCSSSPSPGQRLTDPGAFPTAAATFFAGWPDRDTVNVAKWERYHDRVRRLPPPAGCCAGMPISASNTSSTEDSDSRRVYLPWELW